MAVSNGIKLHNHPHVDTCTELCPANPNYCTLKPYAEFAEKLSRLAPGAGIASGSGQLVALRDKTSAERKGEPIYSGAVMYFPDALAAMARLSVAGNIKHNPGEPLRWARGKSTDQMDAAMRHTITPDAVDPETGETELVAAFWRLGAQLQLQQERLLKAKGVKPYSGITP